MLLPASALFFLLFGFLGAFSVSELSKATFATGKSVLVLCHEGTLAAAGTIALDPCYLVPLYVIELVDGDLAFAWSLFVRHYLLAPPAAPVFEVAAASCLALSLAAFSSSSIFFLSSLGSVLSSL